MPDEKLTADKAQQIVDRLGPTEVLRRLLKKMRDPSPEAQSLIAENGGPFEILFGVIIGISERLDSVETHAKRARSGNKFLARVLKDAGILEFVTDGESQTPSASGQEQQQQQSGPVDKTPFPEGLSPAGAAPTSAPETAQQNNSRIVDVKPIASAPATAAPVAAEIPQPDTVSGPPMNAAPIPTAPPPTSAPRPNGAKA